MLRFHPSLSALCTTLQMCAPCPHSTRRDRFVKYERSQTLRCLSRQGQGRDPRPGRRAAGHSGVAEEGVGAIRFGQPRAPAGAATCRKARSCFSIGRCTTVFESSTGYAMSGASLLYYRTGGSFLRCTATKDPNASPLTLNQSADQAWIQEVSNLMDMTNPDL